MDAAVIISHRHEFIFIHIRKNAGISVTSTLAPYLTRRDFVTYEGPRKWLRNRLPGSAQYRALLAHSSALDVRNEVPRDIWDRYYKFAIVRDPIARIISLYQFTAWVAKARKQWRRRAWYTTPPGRQEDPRRWLTVRAYEETDSFSAFIRHPLVVASHDMLDQVTLLCDRDGNILMDYVGRFERLNEDFAVILKAIGLPEQPLAWDNASAVEGRPILASADESYLRRTFERDFLVFSY